MAAQTLSVLALSTTNPSHSTNLKPPQSSSLAVFQNLRPNGLVNSSFLGQKLTLGGSSNLCSILHKRQSSKFKVFLSLPTKKFANEKIPKWSARALKSFGLGEVAARKLHYTQCGTEGLLMGILVEGTSEAAKYLRANGMTIFNVREEVLKLLGKADVYALKLLGSMPLTRPALRALDWAVEEKLKSGESGEITTTHMLLGIWAQEGYAGHRVLAAFGFDDEKAKELAKSMDVDVVLSDRQRDLIITATPPQIPL